MPEYSEGALYQRMLEQEQLLKLKEDECRLRIQQEAAAEPRGQDAGLTGSGRAGCEPLWDGILCWPSAAPSALLREACPSYVVGFDDKAEASRLCTPDSTWFVHPHTNTTWTNYTLCATGPYAFISIDPAHNTTVLHRWLPLVKAVSQAGYGVSLLTLVLAFLILSLSKKLRCPRNTLHMHLFVSFILRAFMALLKDSLFVQGVGLPSDIAFDVEGQLRFLPEKDNWACKCVTSLWQFCIMANYSWILMEGLYLHNLIFLALFSDSSAITLYVLLGWGLPVLVVVPWVALRATLEDTFCWTTHQNRALFLVIRLPIIVSVLMNFFLFLNIIRVLMLKLKSSVSAARRKARYSKWARSTLVLVPLFGVHYSLFLGMSYSLGGSPTLELLWLFFDQLFASFQGFFVSLLYCLLNGEVRAELMRRWRTVCGQDEGGAAANDEAGVSSLLALSRLHMVRSRGASLPELGSRAPLELTAGGALPSTRQQRQQQRRGSSRKGRYTQLLNASNTGDSPDDRDNNGKNNNCVPSLRLESSAGNGATQATPQPPPSSEGDLQV